MKNQTIIASLTFALTFSVGAETNQQSSIIEKRLIARLPNLGENRIEALMNRVGKPIPDGLYSCLCRATGGGGVGGGVMYEPGSPCKVTGVLGGVSNMDFPSDPAVWKSCINSSKYDDGNTVVDVITKKIGAPKQVNKDYIEKRESNLSQKKIKLKKTLKDILILNTKIYNSDVEINSLKQNLANMKQNRLNKERHILKDYIDEENKLLDVIDKLKNANSATISKALNEGIGLQAKGEALGKRKKIVNPELGENSNDYHLPLTINDFNEIEKSKSESIASGVSEQFKSKKQLVDIEKIKSGSDNLPPLEDSTIGDSQRIKSSGDPDATLAEYSPAMKLIRLKGRLEQYQIMLDGVRDLHKEELEKTRKKPEFKKMINEEETLNKKIKRKESEKEILKESHRKSKKYRDWLKDGIRELDN